MILILWRTLSALGQAKSAWLYRLYLCWDSFCTFSWAFWVISLTEKQLGVNYNLKCAVWKLNCKSLRRHLVCPSKMNSKMTSWPGILMKWQLVDVRKLIGIECLFWNYKLYIIPFNFYNLFKRWVLSILLYRRHGVRGDKQPPLVTQPACGWAWNWIQGSLMWYALWVCSIAQFLMSLLTLCWGTGSEISEVSILLRVGITEKPWLYILIA